MPGCYSTLWTYPWDLAEAGAGAGADAVARRLREEIGLDAMSQAAAYHSFDMLRPHAPGPVLLQIPHAAVYFQPQADLYRDTTIRPHVSPRMGAANWYADAARACREAGLDLIAWTVFLHNSHQAGLHPECAEVACTGDVSTAMLCPANPDVRAYAAALARDLAVNYGIAVLECESLAFGGFGHTHYHVKHGAALGAGGQFLLSLCFCAACRKAARNAGLDPEVLARAAETRLRACLSTGRPIDEPPAELLEGLPGLAAYTALREDAVASLVQEVRAAAGVPVSFIFMGDRFRSGADRKRIAALAEYAEVLSYTADPGRTAETVSRLLPDLPAPDRLVVGLQAYPPASPDARTLGANLARAMELGVRRFSFYNYGIMPPANLAWVREALASVQPPRAP